MNNDHSDKATRTESSIRRRDFRVNANLFESSTSEYDPQDDENCRPDPVEAVKIILAEKLKSV